MVRASPVQRIGPFRLVDSVLPDRTLVLLSTTKVTTELLKIFAYKWYNFFEEHKADMRYLVTIPTSVTLLIHAKAGSKILLLIVEVSW